MRLRDGRVGMRQREQRSPSRDTCSCARTGSSRAAEPSRTYAIECAAHARAVATAKGRRIGRPVVVDPARLDYAAHVRHTGHTIAEIVAKTGIPRTSLYRHLPPRAAPSVTADSMAETDAKAMRAGAADAD